jgi:hypothetical protein
VPTINRVSKMPDEANFAALGVLGYCLTWTQFLAPIWVGLDPPLKTVDHAPQAKLLNLLDNIVADRRATVKPCSGERAVSCVMTWPEPGCGSTADRSAAEPVSSPFPGGGDGLGATADLTETPPGCILYAAVQSRKMKGNMSQSTHHKRAGKLGGEATKARHGDDGFYQRIGALGGKRAMELHPDRYDEIRRHAGQSTSTRYGRDHYRKLAARSARQRQARNELRDQAIQHMLDGGWKIPTIISLTWDDLSRLGEYLHNGLGEYLEGERPDTDCDHLFVSRSGRPLGLANTYAVMKRFRERRQK